MVVASVVTAVVAAGGGEWRMEESGSGDGGVMMIMGMVTESGLLSVRFDDHINGLMDVSTPTLLSILGCIAPYVSTMARNE
ncbi:hypothetical protein Tco_0195494 [Tanacetum coccineum]